MKNIKMMIKLEGMLNKVKEYLSKQDEKRTDEKTLWNTFKGEYLNTVNDDIYREGMKKANEEFQKLAEVEDLIKMIKFDIDVCRFLEGEKSLGNEEFEMLLKRFEIKVNPRTMSWIRKSLSMIGVGNYSYEGNKSGVVLDLADKLADALEDGYKFIDDSVIDSVIETYEKTRKEYIEFITLDNKDVVDDSKNDSINDSKTESVVNEGNNTIDNDIKAKVIRVNNMLLCHNDSMTVIGNEYDLDKGKTYLKYGTYAIEIYYLDTGKICIKAYDSNTKVLNGNSRIVKGIKGILKLNSINWTRGSDTGSIEIDIDDV